MVAVVVAIAGDVAGLRSDFTHHLRAHVFDLVFELDFFGHRYTSLVTVGPPNFFSRTTLRPLGPSVTFHGVGQFIDSGPRWPDGSLLRTECSFQP